MSGILVALCGFAVMLALMFARVPIAIAMAATGFFGIGMVSSWRAAFYVLRDAPYERASSYTFLVVPLFLMMGFAAARTDISKALFRVANAWLGHLRGGLAVSAVMSSASFGAICGSSIATSAAVCSAILPEMRRYRYGDAIATGSIAAGGTLGIMIPPSIIFIIYAIATETSPARLLMAGIIPGLLGVFLISLTILAWVRLRPEIAPPGTRSDWSERFTSLLGVWPIVLLFGVVIGSIYLGVATPTESAAFGVVGVLVLGVLRKTLSWADFRAILTETATTSAMIFVIIIGADIFSYFIAITRMPVELAQWLGASGLSPQIMLLGIFVIYILLGAVMDEISMLLLTLPVFFPLVNAMGVDAVWFGVMIVIMVQIGMLTPPVGINVYVVSGFARGVPVQTIFKGVLPLVGALLVLALIIAIWPGLPSLLIPET